MLDEHTMPRLNPTTSMPRLNPTTMLFHGFKSFLFLSTLLEEVRTWPLGHGA
jgi:hypothetical protein